MSSFSKTFSLDPNKTFLEEDFKSAFPVLSNTEDPFLQEIQPVLQFDQAKWAEQFNAGIDLTTSVVPSMEPISATYADDDQTGSNNDAEEVVEEATSFSSPLFAALPMAKLPKLDSLGEFHNLFRCHSTEAGTDKINKCCSLHSNFSPLIGFQGKDILPVQKFPPGLTVYDIFEFMFDDANEGHTDPFRAWREAANDEPSELVIPHWCCATGTQTEKSPSPTCAGVREVTSSIHPSVLGMKQKGTGKECCRIGLINVRHEGELLPSLVVHFSNQASGIPMSSSFRIEILQVFLQRHDRSTGLPIISFSTQHFVHFYDEPLMKTMIVSQAKKEMIEHFQNLSLALQRGLNPENSAKIKSPHLRYFRTSKFPFRLRSTVSDASDDSISASKTKKKSFAELEVEERREIESMRDELFMHTTMRCFQVAYDQHSIENQTAKFDKPIRQAISSVMYKKLHQLAAENYSQIYQYGVSGVLTPAATVMIARFFLHISTGLMNDDNYTSLHYAPLPGSMMVKREEVPKPLWHMFFGAMAMKAALFGATGENFGDATVEPLSVRNFRDAFVHAMYGKEWNLEDFHPAAQEALNRGGDSEECVLHMKQRLKFAVAMARGLVEAETQTPDHIPKEREFFDFVCELEERFGTQFEDPDNTIKLQFQRSSVVVGKGASGTVFRCVDANSGHFLALKVLPLPRRSDPREEQQIRVEIDTLRKLHHPNIISYFGCRFDRSNHEVTILMEYCPKSLKDLVKEHSGLLLPLVAQFGEKALAGLEYCHSKRLLHRDFKPANILITEQGEAKLSDFGSAQPQHDIETENTFSAAQTHLVGTPLFLAPELFHGALASEASDIWSFGCTMIELITGLPPYPELTKDNPPVHRLLQRLSQVTYAPSLPSSMIVPQELTDLLQQCLHLLPDSRPPANQLLHHSFFRLYKPIKSSQSKKDEKLKVANTTLENNNSSCTELSTAPFGEKWLTDSFSAQPSAETCRALFLKKKFQKVKVLGRGTSGTVYSAVLGNGMMVAIKEIPIPSIHDPDQLVRRQESIAEVKKEIETLEKLQHENVLSYFGACGGDFLDNSNALDDPDCKSLMICTEIMTGGTLRSLAVGVGEPLKESVVRAYVRQAVEGLSYIHSKGIAHRDIKGDNLMLNHAGCCKLADFGACKVSDPSGQVGGLTLVGTPVFMAPELLNAALGEQDEGKTSEEIFEALKRVDIWALGITVLETLNCGNPPWPDFSNALEAFTHIADDTKGHPIIPDHLSKGCKDFCQKCLSRDPEERATAKDLLAHLWLQDTSSTTFP